MLPTKPTPAVPDSDDPITRRDVSAGGLLALLAVLLAGWRPQPAAAAPPDALAVAGEVAAGLTAALRKERERPTGAPPIPRPRPAGLTAGVRMVNLTVLSSGQWLLLLDVDGERAVWEGDDPAAFDDCARTLAAVAGVIARYHGRRSTGTVAAP